MPALQRRPMLSICLALRMNSFSVVLTDLAARPIVRSKSVALAVSTTAILPTVAIRRHRFRLLFNL